MTCPFKTVSQSYVYNLVQQIARWLETVLDTYSIADAERELLTVLDLSPKGAVAGEWTATTMQAGHSSRTGGYRGADGSYLTQGLSDDLDVIDDVVNRLEEAAPSTFNSVTIRWKKSRIPFMRGQVTVETAFDRSIVPRGPDDPIYETAAQGRRTFWQSRGDVADDYAAKRGEPNSFGQTKWFGPHRRVLLVRRPDRLVLATDGLSTPWAGIPDEENGVECELMLELEDIHADAETIGLWADLLISIGDLVADGHRVARDIEKHGAILFCRLTEDYLPATRMILSTSGQTMTDMPFGTVPLIRATPVAEEDVADRDPDEDWSASAARSALQRRGIVL